MSVSYESDYARSLQRRITWDKTRSKAASLLAVGHNKQYVADQVGVTRMTIYNWLDDPEFAAEVDRLSTMMDIAGRAERLRDAMRVLRSMRDANGVLLTEKDALDWLKYAQSETDGAKLDFGKLTELLAGTGDDNQPSQQRVIDVAAGGDDSRLLSDGPASDGEHGPPPLLATEDDALNPS